MAGRLFKQDVARRYAQHLIKFIYLPTLNGGNIVIHINDWMKSLPQIGDSVNITDEITAILKKVTNVENRLSELFSELLTIGKYNNLDEIVSFCSNELKGYNTTDPNFSSDFFDYRVENVCFSMGNFVPLRTVTSTDIINYLKSENNYFDFKLRIHQSITEIESYISNLKGDTAFTFYTVDAKKVLPTYIGKDTSVTIYLFHHNYVQVYKKIRQKTIDLLISL